MADIHFEIFDNADFGNKNLRFSEAPAQEQRDFLKQNGYGFTTRYGGVWYPRTKEAKDRNSDFVKEFAEKFYPESNQSQPQNQIERLAEAALENNPAEVNSPNDERIAYLENLIAELKEERKHDQEKISRLEAALENQTEENIAELEMRQEQAELDDETEWEKENTLTEAEERAYLEKQSEIKIPAETIKLTSEILDSLHEAAEKESLADEPQAEKEILHDSEKSVDNNLTVSPKELAIAKSVLPTVQYVSTLKFAQGEEREFFVNKIKEIAVAVENAPKINATDGLEEHRIVLRYFHPSGTQSFITEIGKDGDAFGFQCLNDDWYNAEWGYINLDELKNIRGMEVDFHVPAGMTVERFLYKEAPEQFPKYAKFTNKENAPAQNKKSPFDVAMETGNDIEAIAAQLKTYHTLKEEDVKDLEIISDEDFSDIVDSIILNDYRHIPNIIRLPNLNAELCEKLGLAKDSAFIMKKSTTHIRPNRKGNYEQAFDTEEYRLIPQVIREANFVLVDKRTQNFQVVFDDKDNISKINKIVFNKDELGNYIVTIGKVDRRDGISEKDNTVVGVGVAPTISALRFPEEQPATRLRPSPTTVNQNIPQTVEKSSLEELSSANETRITWDDILQAAEGSHWNDAANAVYNNARNQIAEYAKNLGVDIENSESPEEVIGTFAAAHEEISFSKDGSLVIDEFLKPIYFNNLTDEQKEEVINGYRSADDQQMLEEDNYYKEKEKIPKSSQKKIREQCREILKKPDSEITEADKKILAQYEGGGGLNENNRTNSEVLNAFYTPDNLIEKVWELVDAYAPDAKTVLEPSAGVGKFANNRPDNKFTMHELNETSARINKILHPEADVIQGAFQKQFLDDGERFLKIGYEQPKHDVVIGNPPYGKYNDKYKGLGEGREFDRYEEYFIARGLEALKDEKSVLAFVVPSGFLNTASDKQKSIIASKGEILDAYRLPEGTFSTTEVGTDILIMRKKESLDDRKNISGELLSDGEWFKNHPEKILGEIKTRTNRFGKEEEYVAVHEGLSVQDELNKIDSFVDEIKKANQTEKLKDPLPEYSSDEENTEIISSPEIFTDEFAENITKFKKSLNNYFEKGIRPENDRFVIGKTPLVLQKTGSDVTEVTVPVSVIKKALETHGLSQDEIFSSLAKMYNPVLVFDSDKNATENKVNSKLILTDVFKDENPVALAVNVNSDVKLKDSNISVEVQDIRSVHDRNVVAKNGTDLIQKWANNGLCRYVNDKKISEWSSLARVQFPVELLHSDNSNILTSTALVNSIFSEQNPLEVDEQKQEDEKSFEKLLDEYNRKYWGPVEPEDTRYDVSPVTEERLSEIKNLSKELSEYFEKGIRPENDRFVIGKTPRVLQETGSEYTDVTVTVSVIKKAVETHGLSEKEILNALTRLATPVLVFDSDKNATENKVESKLVLTDVFKDENPVALAVNVNDSVQKQENGHRKQIEVQNIRSIHDRTVVAKNGVDLIQKWANNGLCRYVDDKKITDWSTVARVYFPIEVLQSDKSNILTRTSLVNSVSSEQAPLEENEKTEPEKNNASPKARKEKWNISKSKGDVMTAEEFSHLYGRDFDEREFPIWKATDWQGNIDLSKLSGDDIQYLSESGKYVEKNFGEWTHKELFTSGDIYAKIQEQRELYVKSDGNRIFADNIKLLESAMKSPLEIEKIHFGVKTALAETFTVEHIDAEGNKVNLNLQESFILWAQNAKLADRKWRGDVDFAIANISREELGEELSFYDIVNYIDGKPVKAEAVRGWRTYDMSEEEKAAEKAERRKEADLKRQARSDTANRLFDRYLHEGLSESDTKRLSAEYNRRFNSYVAPDYSKLPLFVDGMSAYKGDSKFKLYDQQIKGISFLCNKGNGLLAYDVGVGKTAAGIVATVNQIQTGRSKRPLIIVPNQVYSKWYTDIRQLFPNIKVNDLYNFGKDSVEKYIDSENLHRLNIPENSISLCTYEALKNITFTDESCENELYEDFASLLSADMDGSARNNAESSDKIKGIIGSASHVKDESYFFYEDCGFDNLTVDEAHNFKNLWVVPRPKKKGESNEYAGIPSGKPSARALKMYGMTQLTQRHNDDRNVFMLTATPFTNSPTEVYSMLSYIGRERLKQAGITSLRAFFDEFAQTKQELGVTSTGNIDTKQVMKSWKELSALQNILTEFIDKVDGEEAGIIRPNKFTHVKPLDMSDLQKEMREIDEDRMAEVKEGNSAAVIVAMNNMRLSCVAPALANPAMYPGIELPPLSKLVETSPKLKFVCDAIIDMYKGNPEKGQFMYVPLGKESHGIIKDYLVAHGIPKNAVEIINGEVNNTPEKKEKITSCFNDEKNPCKIIIGGRNTAEGIDLNGNSFVMYNCSLGWNPSETIQAEGRIWRQGNLQGNVHIVYPVMNDSIDSVLYQKHDEKRSRINELWNYKGDSLNVEDINPEDLKLDLIKDPNKKAKLILQEETKEARAELSRLNLKIKSFDEIIEKRKQFELDFSDAKEIVDYQKKQIESYKESGLEVPEWIKSELKDCNKKFSKAETGLEKVNEKLSSLKITDSEKEAEYIHSLNNQKHACEEKINNIEKTLPQILKKLDIERMEQKLIEYPVEKQREILEADILNNLRPMKEVEYEIKTMRHEAMLSAKLKAGEITESEFSLYKNAGYEKYEKWLNGEIESLEENTVKNESTKENSSIKNENDIEKIIVYYDGHWADERGEKGKGWKYQEKSFDNPKDALEFYNTAKIPKDVGAENKNGFRFNFMNPEERLLELISEHDKTVSVHNESVSENTAVEKPAQTDLEKAAEKTENAKQPEQDMDSLYADSGSLFFGFNDSDILSVHSPENEYRKSEPYDDFSITERQLTESELKRDEIIFPVLNGKESGMYKSFKDFAEHGVFDVQGKSVELDDSGRISETGWNQLQAAMEIYRNKQFETFRYVLIGRENGEIKDQLAVKSYSPNRCAVSTPDLQTIKQVITRAEELDCMVAAVHNHPSGNTAESSFDAELTESLKRALTNGNGLCRFAGHIILDHDTFNLYTPQNGWKMKLNSNAYGNSEDKLLNKNFAFLKDSVDYTWQLENVAKKINDKNNWNDNFIPVVFADSLNHVSGIKLYDKSFFDNEPQKIRNELQFSGLEANSVKAFPVITKNFSETMSAVDELLFEDKLKNLVEHSAFIDAALPESTVTEKFNILPGRQYFDVHGAKLKNPDIEATWETRINPALFSEPEHKTMRKKEVAFER
ncbi:MuF-C-terminal domain-containing protein [Treponema succinifaciens]|uniref:MuF-C-terminal domain-containing protein n=2 Tax=Treponema TaxID=157 RepID=UPI002352F13F|nr:SNF2-related protein [Treponema succinifaciens]